MADEQTPSIPKALVQSDSREETLFDRAANRAIRNIKTTFATLMIVVGGLGAYLVSSMSAYSIYSDSPLAGALWMAGFIAMAVLGLVALVRINRN